jgi:hypothetical protein
MNSARDAHDIEKGLPRYSGEGTEFKSTFNIAARSSIVNISETRLEYPRDAHEILHVLVASPRIMN